MATYVAGKDSGFQVSEDGASWTDVDGVVSFSADEGFSFVDNSKYQQGGGSGDYNEVRQHLASIRDVKISFSACFEDDSGQLLIRQYLRSGASLYVRVVEGALKYLYGQILVSDCEYVAEVGDVSRLSGNMLLAGDAYFTHDNQATAIFDSQTEIIERFQNWTG